VTLTSTPSPAFSKDEVKDLYPLSPLQDGMSIHALREPESLAYVELFSFRLRGPFDPAIARRAWVPLFRRHDVLRGGAPPGLRSDPRRSAAADRAGAAAKRRRLRTKTTSLSDGSP
jgi:hypothetical protein